MSATTGSLGTSVSVGSGSPARASQWVWASSSKAFQAGRARASVEASADRPAAGRRSRPRSRALSSQCRLTPPSTWKRATPDSRTRRAGAWSSRCCSSCTWARRACCPGASSASSSSKRSLPWGSVGSPRRSAATRSSRNHTTRAMRSPSLRSPSQAQASSVPGSKPATQALSGATPTPRSWIPPASALWTIRSVRAPTPVTERVARRRKSRAKQVDSRLPSHDPEGCCMSSRTRAPSAYQSWPPMRLWSARAPTRSRPYR